ncbi:MAG TPA: hypothetical protein VGW76_16320 [Pyrinomonadaceae bacterium]|nr:hypothetical protein [Pyrinomonadaceae bacterium]
MNQLSTKRALLRLAIVALLLCAMTGVARSQQGEAPLTNAAVVKLVRAGFKEKTIIAIIHNRLSRFNLDPDRLIELKRNGVSENIILAMLARNESFVFMDDDWTDNSEFRANRSGGFDPKSQSGSSDIFGSSSGSRSQSSGRGMRGGNEGETTTTGSATVRIIRPPAEAGGASLKLEKTATLTNEEVIKLVEAGFSEGTIIKRIEDSPVEFDLSTAKLEELRRRRVTEPIIVAMTAAMADDSGNTQSTPRSSPNRIRGN